MQCILEAISVLMMYIFEFHEIALFAFLIFKLRVENSIKYFSLMFNGVLYASK